MNVFNVGSVDNLGYYDTVCDLDDDLLDLEQYKPHWVVYAYYGGCYEGGGDLVLMEEGGNLYHFNLSHCSCYGPLDGGFGSQMSHQTLDREDFLGNQVMYTEIDKGVYEKVKDLLT